MTTNPLPELPVSAVLPALSEALGRGNSAVLVAPPGAGKTTLVPLALLDAPWLGDGKIVLLEPRRLAARAAARRMAQLARRGAGATVGYAMRMENRTSAKTRIVVVTEGVLARMILDDPELPGVSAVIFDEFHERSLDGDFGLALALDVQGALRPDLRLLVMSATLDGARVAKLLSGAPVIESEGRAFPVDVRYDERPAGAADRGRHGQGDPRGARRRERQSCSPSCPASARSSAPPSGWRARLGAGHRHRAALRHARRQGAGRGDQAGAGRPPQGGAGHLDRRDLASPSTACASSSIPACRGCRATSRPAALPGWKPCASARPRPTSAPAAPGARKPGVAIRLWRAEQTAALPAFTPPEILEADLSGLLLDCAAFGVADPAALAFLDPPPAPALNEARALLRALDAIDEAGRLTEAGMAMRKLALPVRLAHMVAEAARSGHADEAAMLAVLLTERGLGGEGADLERRLMRFRSERSPRATAARQFAERLARQAPPFTLPLVGRVDPRSGAGWGQAERGTPTPSPSPCWQGSLADPPHKGEGAGACLSMPGRTGWRRHAASAAASCWPTVPAPCSTPPTRWRASRFWSSPICRARRRMPASRRPRQSARTISAPRWPTGSRPAGKRASTATAAPCACAKPCASAPLPCPSACCRHQPARTPTVPFSTPCASMGCRCSTWSKEAQTLRQRLSWLHRGLGAPWPDMSDAALLDRLDDWLLPFLSGAASFAAIDPGIVSAGARRARAARLAAQDRYAGAHPFRCPVGQPCADPL